VPELPEIEITVRRLDSALAGALIAAACAPGINTLKSFAPPLDALDGLSVDRVRRRGKQIIVEAGGELALLMHLMSAGRLQLFDKTAGPRDRTSRLLVTLVDGRELRLREFGTKQAAWAKLVALDSLDDEESLTRLGPEAWPAPPADLGARLAEPRPLHAALRDQRVIAGIGRSWVDEILWTAHLSPFKRGPDLDAGDLASLSEAIASTLDRALEHYERTIELPIPDKLPMPLLVHRREGEPCPRCGTRLEAVNYEDYVMSYCPVCQTDGRVLKDRRLSRLLK
jgi:formamidopyrimidine-DNA glycosylase